MEAEVVKRQIDALAESVKGQAGNRRVGCKLDRSEANRLVRVVDPWRAESTGVEDPWLDEDEAGKTVSLARAVPTDGANCRSIDSANPLVVILGFRVLRTYARW